MSVDRSRNRTNWWIKGLLSITTICLVALFLLFVVVTLWNTIQPAVTYPSPSQSLSGYAFELVISTSDQDEDRLALTYLYPGTPSVIGVDSPPMPHADCIRAVRLDWVIGTWASLPGGTVPNLLVPSVPHLISEQSGRNGRVELDTSAGCPDSPPINAKKDTSTLPDTASQDIDLIEIGAQEIAMGIVTPSYYYPYDSYAIAVGVKLASQYPNADCDQCAGDLPTNVSVTTRTPQWKSHVTFVRDKDGEDGNWLLLEISRPVALRIFAGILLFTLAAFIFGILFVRETGSILEIAVGLVVGMWGIQSILTPKNMEGRTIVQDVLLMLYVLLALVLFVRFLILPLWHVLGSSPAKDMPYAQNMWQGSTLPSHANGTGGPIGEKDKGADIDLSLPSRQGLSSDQAISTRVELASSTVPQVAPSPSYLAKQSCIVRAITAGFVILGAVLGLKWLNGRNN